jgi:hypothetical protein
MSRPRILRLLRIVFSIVCGIVGLLLIAFWGRSYWWMDQFGGPLLFPRDLEATSMNGGFVIQIHHHSRKNRWYFRRTSLVQPGLAPAAFRFGGDIRLIHKGVCLPHWFLVITVGAFAAVPWIRWSPRYALRTLLIVTTLVAVVLGLAVAH